MPNYTKLFNSIVTSTIWTEDDKTRIIWITMLAIADQNGEVHASIPGLARLAGVPLESTETAIQKFLGPDPYSRTPDNDGRRIEVIDGGWELLNHAKYRRMASLADQKDANAKRQKRFRERNATVTDSNATVTPKTDKAEAEADKNNPLSLPNPIEEEEVDESEPEPTRDMLDLEKRVQSLRSDWNIPLSYAEMRTLRDNKRVLAALTEPEWNTIREYLRYKPKEGEAFTIPRSRAKFLEWIPEIYRQSKHWQMKTKPNNNRTGRGF